MIKNTIWWESVFDPGKSLHKSTYNTPHTHTHTPPHTHTHACMHTLWIKDLDNFLFQICFQNFFFKFFFQIFFLNVFFKFFFQNFFVQKIFSKFFLNFFFQNFFSKFFFFKIFFLQDFLFPKYIAPYASSDNQFRRDPNFQIFAFLSFCLCLFAILSVFLSLSFFFLCRYFLVWAKCRINSLSD